MFQGLKLHKVVIKGFKSFDHIGQEISIDDLTILLGANGSGKSNLVSFFKMLNYITTEGLQTFIGKYGARQLLYYGPKNTEKISFSLHFRSQDVTDIYTINLSYGLPDRLFISGEVIDYHKEGFTDPRQYIMDSGTSETGLKKEALDFNENLTKKIIYQTLSQIRTYQFHDTSETAKIKDRVNIDDASYLRHDAGNLAAFLKMLKETSKYQQYYQRIVRHIKRIMPQFDDFILDTIPGNEYFVRLNWKDSLDNDYLFGPDQLSDGSLRFMALATLLLQPPDIMPQLIVIDEPELGLHPEAISILAGMIKNATKYAQVLVATQSPRLVDEFSTDNIVIVERNEKEHRSEFKNLNTNQLKDWLENYSLSELWEKNVLGGQP